MHWINVGKRWLNLRHVREVFTKTTSDGRPGCQIVWTNGNGSNLNEAEAAEFLDTLAELEWQQAECVVVDHTGGRVDTAHHSE